jgi:MFS family permease
MMTRALRANAFGLLPLLCALYLLLYLDRVNIAAAAPLIQSELHLRNAALGVVLSAFAYSYAFCQLIGGFVGERFGPRRTLLASVLVVCVATAATGLANGLVTLIAARMVLGFGEGAALPTATQAMAKHLPQTQWGFAQGITHGFARLGNFATPPIVAALIALSSWRVSFFVFAVGGLIWVAAWIAWFGETTPQEKRAVSAPALRLWLSIARQTAPATAVNFCYGWTLWLFLTWIPSFFVQIYHLSLFGSAFYSAGVFLGGLAGDALGGVASDRILRATGNLAFARRSVIVTGFLGGCACLLAVMFATDVAAAAVLLSLSFFFAELIVAPIWAVTMDIVPAHPGPASGIMNFGSAFAGIVSPLFFGIMVDITGSWTIPFGVSVALLVIGAALTFALHPEENAGAAMPLRASDQLEATSFGAGGGAL